MVHEPAIFETVDEADDAAADAEGIADLDAGRVISHDAMKAWLLSWDTPNKPPPPEVRTKESFSG
jgi:predicted transcriptional regulator